MSPVTVSSGVLPPKRRKQATYGKQSRNSLGNSIYDFGSLEMMDASEQEIPEFATYKSTVSAAAAATQTKPYISRHLPLTDDAATSGQKHSSKLRSPPKSRSSQQLSKPPQGRLGPSAGTTAASSSLCIFDVPSDEDLPRKSKQLTGRLPTVTRRIERPVLHNSGSKPLRLTGNPSSGLQRPTKRSRHSLSLEPEDAPAFRSPLRSPILGTGYTKKLGQTGGEGEIRLTTQTSPHDKTITRGEPSKKNRRLQAMADIKSTLANTTKNTQKLELPQPVPLSETIFAPNIDKPTESTPSPDPVTFGPDLSPPTRPSTPSRPSVVREGSISTTPKQAELWNALLSNQSESYHSNSEQSRTPSRPALLQRTTTARARLIDTLVAADDTVLSSDGVAEDIAEEEAGNLPLSMSFNNARDPQHESAVGSQPSGYRRVQSNFTYGEQRSFLEEPDFTMGDDEPHISASQSILAVTDTATKKQASQQGLAVYESSQANGEGDSQGMRSIHELRAAADSFQFENDLLLDDIERNGRDHFSRKRNALLEICSRLNDNAFRERFIQNGLELRIVSACREESDPIVLSIVAGVLVYVLLGNTTTHLSAQLIASGAVDIVHILLANDKEIVAIAKDRRSNMSKMAQGSISVLQNTLSALSGWGNATPKMLTPRLIGLKAWELLVRKARKDGETSSLLTKSQLAKLLRLLEQKLQRLDSKDFSSGPDDRLITHTLLSLVEALTIAEACAVDDTLWTSESLAKLVAVLDNALGVEQEISNHAEELVLRICLNLANNHEDISEAFSSASFIKRVLLLINRGFRAGELRDWDDSAPADLDKLILALGVMLNLAEWSEAARLAVLSDTHAFDTLIQTFIDSRGRVSEADSLATSRLNVAHGYLAIILGNLCNSKRVRMHIQSKLPNASFAIISSAVDEFLLHHMEADRASEGNDSWVAFTHRLAVVGEMLKTLVNGPNA